MSRKVLLILIIILMLSLGGISYWYFFVKNATPTDSGVGATDSIFNKFNPFGQGTTDTPATDEPTQVDKSTDAVEVPVINSKFKQITTVAISGATFIQDIRPVAEVTEVPVLENTTTPNKTATTPAIKTPAPKFENAPAIKYVERSTGHIFERFLDTGAEGKISNSTIPAIYEAFFGGSTGKNLIYRYLSSDGKKVQTFLATLGAKESEFLPENIGSVSISPDTNRFFYLAPFSDGVVGIVRSFNDTKKSQIFTSPFTDWLTQWVNPQTILLTTKASSDALGYVYKLNTTNNAFSKVFGGVFGLTTLGSPDGDNILYSTSTSTAPKLGIYKSSNHSSIDIDAYGLPEKCVWGKSMLVVYCAIPNSMNKEEPELWYQGLTSFNDHFIKIDSVSGNTTLISNNNSGSSLDAIHLFLDDTESTLFFTNKKDSTLWSLGLK